MATLSSMAYSDQVIYQTVKDLLNESGGEQHLSQTLIAERSGASLRTVQRAIPRLIKAGRLLGEFTPQAGYTYRIPDGKQQAPVPN